MVQLTGVSGNREKQT